MKNLVLLGERRTILTSLINDHDDDCAANTAEKSHSIADLCEGSRHNLESEASTVVLTNNGLVISMNKDGDILWKCDLEELEDVGHIGGWFDVSFIDPELVCLSRRGAIMTVNPLTGEAELVGLFDQGLEAASWSPDKEVLLMVTSTVDEDNDDDDDDDNMFRNEDEKQVSKINCHLMTMNATFEVLAEVAIPQYIPSLASVDSLISVAWRPDGKFCSVSSVDAVDTMRNVRIYKRETLEPHATGRSEDARYVLPFVCIYIYIYTYMIFKNIVLLKSD